MFKVECMVDDKKLADVLNALVGKVLGPPTATPVINATLANGHIKQEGSGSNLIDLFITQFKKRKGTEFRARDVSNWLESIGRSRLSVTYVLTGAATQKVIKRVGKGTNSYYKVI